MKSFISLVLCTISFITYGQKEKSLYLKFGKISEKELQTKIYSIDSSANAVVLSDIGSAAVEGNTDGWFSISSKRHTIIHILNKNGYDEASIEIPFYVDGNVEEKVSNLKAVTYNLENGKIVETKLDKKDFFIEKVDLHRKLYKFTLPQVKEGSIIEYQYEVTSDFISILDPWYFQSLTAPTIWSEYKFSVPEFFSYNFLSRGYHPLDYNEREDRTSNFDISDDGGTGASKRASFSAGVTDYRWVMKNVPELEEENYTSSIRNHISRLEFQLASQQYPLTPRSYRSTWQEVTKGLLESENFGLKLNANNGWMADDIKPLYAGLTDKITIAKKIFEYVRDNFKCTDKYGVYMDQTLKNVFKTKQGSVPEINLLLTAMLRYAGLEAYPVLVSTTTHGYSFEYSPMINSMNYLVVQYIDANKLYYLDATKPRLGFDRLPLECYNGHSRVVNELATPIYFSADSLKESKLTSFYIKNTENGKWGGMVRQKNGLYESYHIRNEIADKGKDAFFKDIEKHYGATAHMVSPDIKSLSDYESQVALEYELEFTNEGEDILYINPTFGEGYKNNPFEAAERFYPVEMPFTQDEKIITTLEVPNGYKVDELPKQALIKLDAEGQSFFEYLITQSGNIISFRTRIKIKRAFFNADEYPILREFFNYVVKKQSEQIVFKKIP